MTLQSLLDELSAVIAGTPREQLPALMAHFAACQSAVAARLLNGLYGAAERRRPPTEDNALLTIAQVAARLNVPKPYAYELVRQQKLAAVRFGKYVRVAEETLAKYIVTAASSAQ
jgi:excisionase family DNA binding protein